MMKITITVGIITYNRIGYLPDSVNSVLQQQSEASLEVIIVDDGSTDLTKDYLESLIDPRVRVISHKSNQGRPQARNTVIENMRGDFLLWLDDDDILTTNAIASSLECLKTNRDADIVYGKIWICDKDMNTVGRYAYKIDSFFVLHNFLFANAVPNIGTIISKDVFEKVGNYDLSFPRGQDYDFWVRAALQECRFYHNDNYVAFYRQRTQTYSYDRENIRVVKNLLRQTSLPNIFLMYDWELEPTQSKSYSLMTLAAIFYKYNDIKTAISYNLQSLNIYPNEMNNALMRILYEAEGNWEKAKGFPKVDPYIQDISLQQALSLDRHELEIKLRGGLC